MNHLHKWVIRLLNEEVSQLRDGQADRNIGLEYEKWCKQWSKFVYPAMKEGSFVFGARRTIHHVINAFEENGFLLKDMLSWKKFSAYHRAQRVSIVLDKRGLHDEAKKWEGWRIGNLAPIWEPIAFFMKPYRIGSTVTDNIIANEVGALNIDFCKEIGNSTNLLNYGFESGEVRLHEAQKPQNLIKHLIKISTRENQVILDPFMGSATTAVMAKHLNRRFIGFEINEEYYKLASERISSYKQPKQLKYSLEFS